MRNCHGDVTSGQLVENVDLDLREAACCSCIEQKEETLILNQGRKFIFFIVFILLSSIMFSSQGDNYKMFSSFFFLEKSYAMKIISTIFTANPSDSSAS